MKVGRIEQLTHTPGPWIADTAAVRPNHKGSFTVTAANDGVVICGRMGWPQFADESKANARLIAAAPDLLAALKAYVAACHEQGINLGHITGDAEAAIKKAEATD